MGARMPKSQPEKLLLDNVDPNKRDFISKLIGTSAFVAPVVASFAMANLVPAEAQANNSVK